MAVLTSTDKCFKIDGVLMSFNSRDVIPLANGVRFTNRATGQSIDVPVTGTTLNGTPATTVQSILDFVEEYFFNVGGGSGDGGAVSAIVVNIESTETYNIPSDYIGQVIVTLLPTSTGDGTVVLPNSVIGNTGMEVTLVNMSATNSLTIQSDNGIIYLDAGASPTDEYTLEPQTAFVFLCNGNYLISY